MSEAARKKIVQKVVQVRRSDLPYCCPPPGKEVWDMHPRVYLPFDGNGDAVCPYCSGRYHLVD